MMYQDVVADFAHRTRVNLAAIESLHAGGSEVFEVTQLVNSMLGLIVFPREEFFESIPSILLADLQAQGWPVPRTKGASIPARDLPELMRYLRNAIAHFNIEFIGSGDNSIRTLRVWNTHRGVRTWEAELGITELRGIAERFSDLLITESNFTRPSEGR